MARPTTLRFKAFKIEIEDPANPGVFVAPCGFMKKSLKLSKGVSSTVVIDCDDPDLLAWDETSSTSANAAVDGSGVMAMEALTIWRKFWLDPDSWTIRVIYDLPLASNGGYWEGAAVCTDLSDDVDRNSEGARTQRSVSLKSDGPWDWVDADA